MISSGATVAAPNFPISTIAAKFATSAASKAVAVARAFRIAARWPWSLAVPSP